MPLCVLLRSARSILGGLQIPYGLVVRSCTRHPGVWVRFPKKRRQGKQAHPVLEYRVPHGSETHMSSTTTLSLANSFILGTERNRVWGHDYVITSLVEIAV